MEYHEKSVMVNSLMGYAHCVMLSRFGTSVGLWRICFQRIRPTVDESLSSGH